MATYANIDPTAQTVAVKYAASKVLTTSEATIYNQSTGDPIPTHGLAQGIVAIGTATIAGTPDATDAYIIMQTDLGNGVWIDVAWFKITATSGTLTFALVGIHSVSAAIAQTRASGTSPASSSANTMMLGDRVRIVGKATFTNGTNPAVTVSLGYKLLGLR